MLLRLLLLVLAVTAIQVTAKTAMDDDWEDMTSLVSGPQLGEDAATDVEPDVDMPGLLWARVFIQQAPERPQGYAPALRFTPVVVIRQATRAPPLS